MEVDERTKIKYLESHLLCKFKRVINVYAIRTTISYLCKNDLYKVFPQSVHKPKYCFGDMCSTRMTYVEANL